jgi:hypothetical protein
VDAGERRENVTNARTFANDENNYVQTTSGLRAN